MRSVPILAAIVLPVFAQARLAAQRTKCVSNVKILATAQLLYSSDYDDHFPPAGQWMDLTKPFAKGATRAYQCPLVIDGHGYAMSDAMSGKSVTKLADPNKHVLIFETDDLDYNAHGMPKVYTGRHGSQSTARADGSAIGFNPPK